jgi:hypothetical protein
MTRKARPVRVAEVGAYKRPSPEDGSRRLAALIEILEIDPAFIRQPKEFDPVNLVDGRDFLMETDVYDVVIVHSVLSTGVRTDLMPKGRELLTSPDHDVAIWRNRLVSTGAKYIVVCEGQPYTLSGWELGDLPGYTVIKMDTRLAVYKKRGK